MSVEGVPTSHRPSAFNDFQNTIRTWTVGNVSVADDDDQDRLGRFLAELDRRPTWKATFLDILGRTGNVVEAISGCHQRAQIEAHTAPATEVVAVAQPPAPSPCGSGPAPKNPMQFSAARERFKDHSLQNRTTVSRTIQDRHDLLQKVGEHVIDVFIAFPRRDSVLLEDNPASDPPGNCSKFKCCSSALGSAPSRDEFTASVDFTWVGPRWS